MRMIPTRVHGALDYLVGLLLIAAPWSAGFGQGGAETWVSLGAGLGIIVYSLLTQYEWGALRMIPFRVHLWADGALGVLLIASPWLFGFAGVIWLPHVILGAVSIVVPLLTDTDSAATQARPGRKRLQPS